MADSLRLEGIDFDFGKGQVLKDLSLAIPGGSLLTLLGLSGSGKTTLLHLIGGNLKPKKGQIWLNDREITDLSPDQRKIGIVFQNYALFPHLNVRKNVSFGLDVRGVSRVEKQKRVDAILSRVGLDPNLHERMPGELSGGQQQRVALARALVLEPKLLLLDEPFANLDRPLRDQLRGELRQMQRLTGVTTLLVTHDQEEALAISDLVAVLSSGKLLQVDTPPNLYHRPQTPEVAGIIGQAHLLEVLRIHQDHTEVSGGLILPRLPFQAGQMLMIRPEQWLIGAAAKEADCHWEANLIDIQFAGGDQILTATIQGHQGAESTFRIRLRHHEQTLTRGQKLHAGFHSGQLWAIPRGRS